MENVKSVNAVGPLLKEKLRVNNNLRRAAAAFDANDVKDRLRDGADVTGVDDQGRNILHYAVLSKHDATSESENSPGTCSHTVVLQVIKRHSSKKFHKLINEKLNGEYIAHFAVISDCVILLKYLKKLGCNLHAVSEAQGQPLGECAIYGSCKSAEFLISESAADLHHRDKRGITPVQYACAFLQQEMVELMISKDESLLNESDEDERTLVSIVAGSKMQCSSPGRCKHVRLLKYFTEKLGNDALHKKSNIGCGLVQTASATGKCTVLVRYLLNEAKCKVDDPDNDGDTALGDAASHGNKEMVKLLISNGADVNHKSKNGETPFLQACISHSKTTAKILFEKKASTGAVDDCGNTAIHLAARKEVGAQQSIIKFARMLSWLFDMELKKQGNDKRKLVEALARTNVAQQNMFHVLAEANNLRAFIKVARFDSLNPSLFRNSDGLNILHVYSGKYQLSQLQDELIEEMKSSRWQDDEWQKLITESVTAGQYRGYTCLHFACQAGHVHNIKYLIKEFSLSMSQSEQSCPSAMDVLIKHRNIDLINQLDMPFLEIIESVDPVNRLAGLPDNKKAKQTLLPLCDLELKGIVMSQKLDREQRYQSGRVANSGEGKEYFPPSTKLLYLAMKEDSCEIFQCIVALGFGSSLMKDEAGKNFNDYLLSRMKQVKAKNKDTERKKEVSLKDVLPSLRRGFESLLDWKIDSSKFCLDLPSPSLLGIAVRSGRVNVAKELLLIDQIHLIPSCVQVIQECKRLQDEKLVETNSVKDLQDFAIHVALNAMDELQATADKHHTELLHDYLAARFECEGTDSESNSSVAGPEFSFLCSDKKASLFQLIIECGSRDLLSSTCVKDFAEKEWRRGSACHIDSKKIRPQLKFRLHFIGFLLFIIFYTYYICDLHAKIWWADFVMWAFTGSFFLLEIVDLIQILRKRRIAEAKRNSCLVLRENFKDYITDQWNWADVIGIAILIGALSYKLYLDLAVTAVVTSMEYYFVRMILSSGILVWAIRLVSLLRAFKQLGPSISMLKTLLKKDLAPFLVVLCILSIAFGVLSFALLHPDSRKFSPQGGEGFKDWENLWTIFTRPLYIAFGHFEIEELAGCMNFNADWSLTNSSSKEAAICTHPVGTSVFFRILIFGYLIFVNLTMLNLLIAQFSLTVSNMKDQAYMIWSRYDRELLLDYKRMPLLPPPLTLLWLLWLPIELSWRCCCRTQSEQNSQIWSKANIQESLLKLEDEHKDVLADGLLEKLKILSGLTTKQMDQSSGEEDEDDEINEVNGDPRYRITDRQYCHTLNSDDARNYFDGRKENLGEDGRKQATSVTSGKESNESGEEEKSDGFSKFKEFLKFQALTFKDKRDQLKRPRKDHGSVVEKLKVDIQRLQKDQQPDQRKKKENKKERRIKNQDDSLKKFEFQLIKIQNLLKEKK